MSLRRKLLLLFAGFAIVPISLTATVVVISAFRYAEREARASLEDSLTRLFTIVSAELEGERLTLEKVVGDMERAGDREGRSFIGQSLRASRVPPRFLVLSSGRETAEVYSPSFFASTLITEELRLAALPAVYSRLIAAGPESGAPSAIRTGHDATGAVVAVVGAMRATEEHPAQFLITEYPVLELLRDVFSEALFHAVRFEFTVGRPWVEEPSRFLYHPDPSLIGLAVDKGERGAPAGRLLDELIAGGPDDAMRLLREGDRLYAAGVEPTTGWIVGASISLGPRLDPLRRTIGTASVLFGVLILLVVGGILYATHGVGDAVEEIAETTAAIARGNFEHTIRMRRSDEFGAIAEHVNEMSRELILSAESRAIAQISASLVHDLKGVASQLSLLLYNLRENPDDPEFREESLGLMQGLIDQVESLTLRLRRGGPGREPRSEQVDLDALVEKLTSGPAVRSRPGIRVETELGAGVVRSDGEMLEEIVQNVVSNALEAMKDEGTLRVSTGRLGERPPTHYVEVEDSGPGMSEEFVSTRLFRPFATTKEKGIGLGMYSVRQLVGRLGGRLDVKSEPGAGTTIRLEVGAAGEPEP